LLSLTGIGAQSQIPGGRTRGKGKSCDKGAGNGKPIGGANSGLLRGKRSTTEVTVNFGVENRGPGGQKKERNVAAGLGPGESSKKKRACG